MFKIYVDTNLIKKDNIYLAHLAHMLKVIFYTGFWLFEQVFEPLNIWEKQN